MLKKVHPINDIQDENVMSQSYSMSCVIESHQAPMHSLLKGDCFNIAIKKKYIGSAFAILSNEYTTLIVSYNKVLILIQERLVYPISAMESIANRAELEEIANTSYSFSICLKDKSSIKLIHKCCETIKSWSKSLDYLVSILSVYTI